MIEDDHDIEWWGWGWRLCPMCGEAAGMEDVPLFEKEADDERHE
jgi:hypothetical protein